MKVRQDFVTNSSSSSFILAFDSKEDGAEKISAMAKRYGSDYVMQLLHDFMEATPIQKEMFELNQTFLKIFLFYPICAATYNKLRRYDHF